MLKDPLGRVVPLLIVGRVIAGSLLGGATNLAAYMASQAITNKEITTGGM